MSIVRSFVALGLPTLVVLGTAGCTDPATAQQIGELSAKVEALENQVEALKSGGGAAAAKAGPSEEAQAALKAAYGAASAGDWDEARKQIAAAKEAGAANDASLKRALDKVEAEVSVVGKNAPDLAVEKWFQGETSFADGDATLVVFWEVWCPHCRREVPNLNETYTKYKADGLNVVGLTRLTKGKTEEEVTSFMKDEAVVYPIAKEDGKIADYFAVSGIPAAAVVKDGKIVWRGHPARLSDDMIQGWIN